MGTTITISDVGLLLAGLGDFIREGIRVIYNPYLLIRKAHKEYKSIRLKILSPKKQPEFL